MAQSNPSDPFFEQLKADVLVGLAEAERGETVSLEDVIAHAHAAIDDAVAERKAES